MKKRLLFVMVATLITYILSGCQYNETVDTETQQTIERSVTILQEGSSANVSPMPTPTVEPTPEPSLEEKAYRITKSISYNEISVDVVIDKPKNNKVDVLIVYHGTVSYDNKIMEAANKVLDEFKKILDRTDIMIVSVAYPEENLLIGDNIPHAEAALLWIKNKANKELGITVKKIFLGGHSQGGYIVTRLNTQHQTNGVIANAPGPLNLVFRCQLEEDGKIQNSIAGELLMKKYGSTTENGDEYFKRSLLNFTHDFKSDILFVQGLEDSTIQMHSWPKFKQDVSVNNTNSISCKFLDLPGLGHEALFHSPLAKEEFNNFISSR